MVVMCSKHAIHAVHSFVPVLPFCLSYCAAIRTFAERSHPHKIRSLPTKDHDLIGPCRSPIMLIQPDTIESSSHRSRSRQQTWAPCVQMVGPAFNCPYWQSCVYTAPITASNMKTASSMVTREVTGLSSTTHPTKSSSSPQTNDICAFLPCTPPPTYTTQQKRASWGAASFPPQASSAEDSESGLASPLQYCRCSGSCQAERCFMLGFLLYVKQGDIKYAS